MNPTRTRRARAIPLAAAALLLGVPPIVAWLWHPRPAAGPCVVADRAPLPDVADIGDNREVRPRVQIYRVREPAPGDAETAAPEVFNATYEDGPHNAEAMIVAGDDLVIVTRDRTGGVYRANIAAGPTRDLTFGRIGQLGLAAVTDAEGFNDGKSAVVRTSHEALLYRTADLLRGGNTAYFGIPLDGAGEAQGEGIAIDGSMLFLSGEGRPWTNGGSFVSLRCQLPR